MKLGNVARLKIMKANGQTVDATPTESELNSAVAKLRDGQAIFEPFAEKGKTVHRKIGFFKGSDSEPISAAVCITLLWKGFLKKTGENKGGKFYRYNG